MKLENKIAFVSAAGRGIGKAIAKGLAAEGATVVVNSYSEETAAGTADDIKKGGGKQYQCQATQPTPKQF